VIKPITQPVIGELKKLQDGLETQKLAKKFDLKKAGSADGTQNKPEADATTMSPTEIELHAHVNEVVSQAYGKVVQGLKSINADLDILKADLNVEQDIESIKDSGLHLGPKVHVKADGHKSHIQSAASHSGNLVRSYKKFQSDNNLIARVPQYPESWFHHSRLIFIGATVEFILAFPFYYEVAASLLAAFGFAFLVVVLNILPIFISGNLFRFINHVSPAKKWGYSFLSAFLFLLFIAAILLAGHLRTAIGAVVEGLSTGIVDAFSLMTQAGKMAFLTFIDRPFALGGDVLALMFMIASFGFGIFTAWKAYTLDDEYPGYGALDRQKLTAEASLNEKRASMFENLDSLFKESSENTKKAFDEVRSRCNDIVYQITEYRNLAEAYALFYHQSNTNLKSALQIYRAANIYVRSREAPEYFDSEVIIEGLSPETLEPLRQSDIDLADTLDGSVQRLVNVYNETQKIIKSSQKDLYNELSKEVKEIVIRAEKGEA